MKEEEPKTLLPSQLRPLRAFKGTVQEYKALHYKIKKRYGKAIKCEFCGIKKGRGYEWANKSKKYTEKKSDWLQLCTLCHRRYDRDNRVIEEIRYCKVCHNLISEKRLAPAVFCSNSCCQKNKYKKFRAKLLIGAHKKYLKNREKILKRMKINYWKKKNAAIDALEQKKKELIG